MSNCLDNISCTSLSFGTDEGGTLRDAAKCFTEVSCTTDEGNLEGMLVDMMFLICRCENLRLIDIVDTDSLQNLENVVSLES